MMHNIAVENNHKHNEFVRYLNERIDGDKDAVIQIVETAEKLIPQILNSYFGTSFVSLYDICEVNDVEEYRRRIKLHPILKTVDIGEEPRYTEMLKWYRLWLQSQNNNALPIPLPGEYEDKKNIETSHSFDPEKINVQLSTIFLEGEEEVAQPEFYRRRNTELRKACIKYFRSLHNGHIVCECCGFEFAAHYEINDDYIEIHHRSPFSQTEGEHLVDATKDLVPLCANCHRMIHHGTGGKGNCMSLDELKRILK